MIHLPESWSLPCRQPPNHSAIHRRMADLCCNTTSVVAFDKQPSSAENSTIRRHKDAGNQVQPPKGPPVIIDRDVQPQDIRIMFEYSGRKRDGSNAAPQRGIRPWTGNPKAGKGELMNAAQNF